MLSRILRSSRFTFVLFLAASLAACGGDSGDSDHLEAGRYRLTGYLPSGRVSWDYVDLSDVTENQIWVQPVAPDFEYVDGYVSIRHPLPYGMSGVGFSLGGFIPEGTLSWMLQTDASGYTCILLQVNGGEPHSCSFARMGP
jgi:hypothetical protein